MTGIYFSGTGNSKYAVELFCDEYDNASKAFSIEEFSSENIKLIQEIKKDELLVFAYPVQYSTVPKILRDFIFTNKDLWKDKKIFIIATMGLFSGDGAGVLSRLLEKFGAKAIGGLHLKMPDSIGDEKVLKRPTVTNKRLVKNAEAKIKKSVLLLKSGKPTQEGVNFLYRLAGFWGQRLYFGHKTKNYSDKLRINKNKCVLCGKCEKLCPMKNIKISDGTIEQNNQCTMCYRCVNNCPKQAITLLGKKIVEQSLIEKFLD